MLSRVLSPAQHITAHQTSLSQWGLSVSRRDFIPPAPTCSNSDVGIGSSSPDYDYFPSQHLHRKNNSASSENASYASIGSFSRTRNGLMGGSLRCPPARRIGAYRSPAQLIHAIDEDIVSLHGSERAVDVSSPLKELPPRAPATAKTVRHAPPYPAPRPPSGQQRSNSFKCHPPPPYPGRVLTPINAFIPNAASTPLQSEGALSPIPTPPHPPTRQTSSDWSLPPTPPNATPVPIERIPIAAEGEARHPATIRDADERKEKAMSFYENVSGGGQIETSATAVNESTASPSNNSSTVWYQYGCV
jgi:hypothetical protein